MLKRNAMRFVAALLVALTGFVSIPNVALYERLGPGSKQRNHLYPTWG